jgi:hypothetical protein
MGDFIAMRHIEIHCATIGMSPSFFKNNGKRLAKLFPLVPVSYKNENIRFWMNTKNYFIFYLRPINP